MAGLSAGHALVRQGREVVVIDKGRGMGGRLANRRFGGAVFDHGAQFVSGKSPLWNEFVRNWTKSGVLQEWASAESSPVSGQSALVGKPAMTAIAKQLAEGLDVRRQHKAAAIHSVKGDWMVEMEDGPTLYSSSLLITSPIPQTLDLLDAGETSLPQWQRQRMESVTYEKCFAVMAVLKDRSAIPSPGFVQLDDGPISWMADNQQKGISDVPAVTIHASPEYSAMNWNRDRSAVAREILQAAQPWLGVPVVNFQVHGWRYSRPSQTVVESCWVLSYDPFLVLAGDAFGGASVEGAVLSGLAASDVLSGKPAVLSHTH